MFFNNPLVNMSSPQAPVMGAQGSPFAMHQQQMPIPTQQPIMMMQGGQVSQAPQAMLNAIMNGNNFASRGGSR